MTVELHQICGGSQAKVYAFAKEGHAELMTFLDGLTEDAPKVAETVAAFLQRIADHGAPFHNKELCRELDDGIYEFKKGQVRILWFWERGRVMICTHGFSKKSKKTPPGEIKHAKSCRAIYKQAAAVNTVKYYDLDEE